FDLQPELAQRLGYSARGGHSAVERFMKRYFLVAKEVGMLTRVLCAKLEADHAKKAPRGLQRLFDGAKKKTAPETPGFFIDGGRLNIENSRVLQKPANVIKLFEIAERRDLDIHPVALGEVAHRARSLTPAWRKDAESCELMLQVIASQRHPAAALR